MTAALSWALAAFLLPRLCQAQEPAKSPDGVAIARKVLALYDRESITGDYKDISFLQIHQRAEVVLNHLGLEVVYQEAGALPDLDRLGDYAGVVTWFEQPVTFKDPDRVCRWLSAAMARGLRLAVVGDPGLYTRNQWGNPQLSPDCSALFRGLGVELSGTRAVDPASLEIAHASRLMGFERKLSLEDYTHVPLAVLRPGATAYLRLNLSEGSPRQSEPVALTPRGGIALQPFWLYTNKELSPPQFRWVADPFVFFEQALRLKGLPRPDVTTINGRRVYFSHIDGDGFFNRSDVDSRKWSGEIFLREILERYPASPFTISLVTGYYDLSIYGDEAALALSRTMMNLPNVEPASHGYAHPLVWISSVVAVALPGYRMDPRREILGSTEFINARILAPGRRTALFLWTGDCLPRESDLAIAEQAGLISMNGGGGRRDSRFPSYSFLQPLSRRIGAQRQIYAPAFNENDYTNLWQGPYYGYREAIESFEQSGSPKRLKPVNIYLHYYSADKYAGLLAAQKAYAWAHGQPLIPIRAGRYVRSARDFFAMRVRRLAGGRFRFEGGPDVRTVRFDDSRQAPELSSAKGVVGFRREQGNLYVFFDENPTREFRLADAPGPGPYLVEANFEVSRWARRGEGVRFLRQGWWAGQFTLGGLTPLKSYRVASGGFVKVLAADSAGTLRVDFPDSEKGAAPRAVAVEPAG